MVSEFIWVGEALHYMVKKFSVYIIFLFVLTTAVSCLEVGQRVVDWMALEEGDVEVDGKYHILEEDGIRVFLPTNFKRYSLAEYQQTLKAKLSKEEADIQIQNINQKAQLEGELYIYFEEVSGSTCLVFGMPYTEMRKSDAQLFLGMMRTQVEKYLDATSKYEKITAKYVGYPNQYIFKSVYKISSEEKNFEYYNALYFVTRKGKTIAFQIITPVGVYFDPFIEKIEM